MKKRFILQGLECANCAAKIERTICKLDGVIDATVNFFTQKLVIEGEEEKMPIITEETKKIVKKIEPQVVLKKVSGNQL